MMTLRTFFILALLLAGITLPLVQAQENLHNLTGNPILSKQQKQKPNFKSSGESLLRLPFFEDFSVNTLTPNASHWLDNNAFVNKDFPVNPTNTGAATLDVLDYRGRVYEQASSVPFVADYLTSLPFALDSTGGEQPQKLSPADSVYLSFYYQPQGRGDQPETNDSLVLQFGYLTGKMVFDYVDSVLVLADDYLLAAGTEQINISDTVYAPDGCNPDLYLIANQIYTWGDFFLVPCDTVLKPEIAWVNVWSDQGRSLTAFTNEYGTDFRQVLVPLLDTLYFSKGFQFRFFNYGSTAGPGQEAAGNVDQWHIDFVYLNSGRSKNDTSYNKIGFSGRAPSFLKRYESMPYRQYRSAPTNAVKPEISLKITNLSDETKNTRYRYRVNQRGGNQLFEWDGGFCNLPSFATEGFQSCETGCGAKHACPPVASLFALDFENDSASFLIRHYISDSSAANILVDSLVYRQGFYNYFAYDDGTPEAGYSIEPTGAYLAMQFSLSTPDTLSSIRILFNHTTDAESNKYFDLIVWNDNNGIPGDIIYRKIRQQPRWEEDIYGFATYDLDEPLLINGNFYVGLMRESGVLSLGFDKVNNAKDYLFYNIDGNWVNSSIDGALMIRPVMGNSYLTSQPEVAENKDFVNVYPNPASNVLHLEMKNSLVTINKLSLFDYTGRKVIETTFHPTMDLSPLTSGIYLLVIEAEGKRAQTSKIMIKR